MAGGEIIVTLFIIAAIIIWLDNGKTDKEQKGREF
jgi:hypothetical protein